MRKDVRSLKVFLKDAEGERETCNACELEEFPRDTAMASRPRLTERSPWTKVAPQSAFQAAMPTSLGAREGVCALLYTPSLTDAAAFLNSRVGGRLSLGAAIAGFKEAPVSI